MLVSVRTPPILAGGGFSVPPQFDGEQALTDATTLARLVPDRSPGSPTAGTATQTVARWLGRASGVQVQTDRFIADGPDGPVELVNLVAVVPGQSEDAIVLLAHRDDRAPGPGANDNASGTRCWCSSPAPSRRSTARRRWCSPPSTAAPSGSWGPSAWPSTRPRGVRPVAAIALDGVGTTGEPLPILFAGNDGRRSAAGLPRAAIQALETGGVPAEPPAGGEQVLELLQPAAADGAQAPFVDRGISAIQIGDGGDATGPARITRQQLEQVGLALDTLVQRLDTTPESAGTVDAYVMLGERALPAWVLAALAASLLVSPALVAGGLLVRAPGAREAWWPALVSVGRVALPLRRRGGRDPARRRARPAAGHALGAAGGRRRHGRDPAGAGGSAGWARGRVARAARPPRPPASEEAPALLAMSLAVARGGGRAGAARQPADRAPADPRAARLGPRAAARGRRADRAGCSCSSSPPS